MLIVYSYLKASTGFSFAAPRAGRKPERQPIKKEKPKPKNSKEGEMVDFKK